MDCKTGRMDARTHVGRSSVWLRRDAWSLGWRLLGQCRSKRPFRDHFRTCRKRCRTNPTRSPGPFFTGLSRSQGVIEAGVSSWDPDRAVLRPDDVLRHDAPAVKPGEIVRAETFWKRFPDWIVYKRGEPLELRGP